MEVSAVKMKYMSTLISVKDMENSKKFYHDVLGLNVVADFGANVTLDGGVVTADHLILEIIYQN